MSAFRRIAFAAVLLGSSAPCASAQEMKAEVLHWWTSGGELAAVKVFADRVHGRRRHLGRHGDRRRPERAHRRHQPDRRRQSADRHAVQHRQAVRRAGRQRAAQRPRRGGRRRQVARGAAAGDRRGRDPRRQVLRRAGEHPRHRLALVQQAGIRRCRHRRAQDLARGAGGGAEAQGEGHHRPGPGRPALAGAHPVQLGAGRRGRHRAVLSDLPRQQRRRGQGRQVQGGRRAVQAAADHGRSGQPGPQLERRHRPW